MNTQENCIRLIQLYSANKMLWDPKDPNYLNKTHRENSWRQMSAEMQCPVSELKKKMDSLLGSYRREKSRERRTRITASGAVDVYVSKWFAYPYFDFLKHKNETGDTQDVMPIEVIMQPTQPDEVEDTEYASSFTSYLTESNGNEEIPLQPTQEKTNTHTPLRKKRRNNPKDQTQPQEVSRDNMLTDAYECIQRSNDINDAYISFGRHIANELRKYDQHTLACVKNAINTIIFEADMGKYTQQFTSGYFTQHSSSNKGPSPAATPSTTTVTPSTTITPSPATTPSPAIAPSANNNLD